MNSIIRRPGYSDRFDRDRKEFALAFPDLPRFLQSEDLNHWQSLQDDKLRRVAEYTLQDGRIVKGDDPVVSTIAGNDTHVRVLAPDCAIYIAGLVHDVTSAAFNLPNTGNLSIGVRLSEELITDIEDPSLKGRIEGTEAYMEPGAARVRMSVAWGHSLDGGGSDLIPVFQMTDGAILTTQTNIDYSEIYRAIENYSRESNGSYVYSGCLVSALGLNADGEQQFTISEGIAYVNGRRVPRQQSLRFAVKEEPDLRTVSAEPRAFTAVTGGSQTFKLSKAPIAEVTEVTIVREVTETKVHGGYAGVSDALLHSSVESILEIRAGATVYTSPASWILSQGEIDWSPGGAEPAPGSSYTVKYRYYDNVPPTKVTRDSITVAGATQGTNILVDYVYKLPRIDVLAMEPGGSIVYIKGTSAISRPRPPVVPTTRLELARIHNSWGIPPEIVQSDVRNVPYSELADMKHMLLDLYDLVAQERLKTDASSREVAAKRGVFVDPFLDDDMRDQGEPQTAASFGGKLRLPIHGRTHDFPALTTVRHLPFTTEVLISQLRESGAMKINPYATFTPMPGRASIEPSTDIWTEREETWSSPQTQSFEAAAGEAITGVSLEQRIELVRTTTRNAETIRPRSLNFRLEGFIENETLTAITFDGLPITSASQLKANSDGVIAGSFSIPAGVPTGAKSVVFRGSAGTNAGATYIARGTITVEEYRLASVLETTTEVMPQPINPPAVINNITNVTNQITNVTEVTNVTQVTNVTRVNNATRINNQSGRSDTDRESRGGTDPLAQSFMLAFPRCLAGIRLKCGLKGLNSNAVMVQIRTSIAGLPSQEVVAEAFVAGSTLVVGQFFDAMFNFPVFLPSGQEFWFVVLTDDADHGLAIAQLGKLDQNATIISEQPFTIGVCASSSNASTWTVHNDIDLVFQIIGCRFNPVEQTILIGTFPATKMSDIIVAAGVEYPEPVTDIEIRLKRPNGQVIRSAPSQTIRLDDYWQNETVEVSAVLRGTAEVTPFLFPGLQIIEGELQPSATYLTRAVQADGANRVTATFDALLPAGASVKVEVGMPGDYLVTSVASATQLGDGRIEQTYRRTPYAPQDARTRITLSGTPAARPELSALRMVTTEI
ncbi:DUF4815 domain-containing protein [Ensifer adhaerens]|nr:DUF4815 domain-containing protein [Ensifer adhaerens]